MKPNWCVIIQVEEVVDSEHGHISSIAVLNMTDTVPDRKVLKKDIQSLVARLERDKWLSVGASFIC